MRCWAWSRLRVGEPLTHSLVFSKLGNLCSGIALKCGHSTTAVANIASGVAESVAELPIRVVRGRITRWLRKAALVSKRLAESWAVTATISGSSSESGRLMGLLALLVLATVVTASIAVRIHSSRADATRSLDAKSWASE